MSSLTAYQFFNSCGNALFITGFNSYATSFVERKHAPSLFLAGATSKLISLLPFYYGPDRVY